MYVYSCHTPAGAPVGTAGWTQGLAAGGAQFRNDCAASSRGSLLAEGVGGPVEWVTIGGVSLPVSQPGQPAWWRFESAPDTVITGFAASVCMRGAGRISVHWPEPADLTDPALSWAGPGTIGAAGAAFCNGVPPYWADARNLIQRQGLQTPRLHFVAREYGAPHARTSVELASFRADIRDDVAPAVSAVRGPLASNLTHTGVESVEFDVSDVGVGVYRAVVEARLLGQGDWLGVSTGPLAHSQATCAETDATSHPYEFDSPRPCPLRIAGARLDFNTDVLAVGEHEIRVVVEDAAGNRATVVTPRKFIAEGPAAAAPALVAAGKTTLLRISGPARRTVTSGGAFRLRGRLTDVNGEPLSGMALAVRTRPFLPKPEVASGDWSMIGQVVTGQDGTFDARIPAGASRTVQVSRDSADGLAAAAVHTDVIVPAQVSAKARATRIRNGQSAVFTGRVRGPIPSGGVLVALEVREPGRWIPVATTRRWVRTSASGTFRLAYRFRRTFQASTYRFRVVAAEDSAFEYSRGASRTIDVRVNP
jgi:hypothetical protein